jgi:hypothetical protein
MAICWRHCFIACTDIQTSCYKPYLHATWIHNVTLFSLPKVGSPVFFTNSGECGSDVVSDISQTRKYECCMIFYVKPKILFLSWSTPKPHPIPPSPPPPPHYQTAKLPGASSLLRAMCIFSDWTQTQQSSAMYVLEASYQLVYAAWLVIQCLRILGWGGGRLIETAGSPTGLPSPQFLSAFPNSPTEVSCCCPLIGCKYLHLTLSAAC